MSEATRRMDLSCKDVAEAALGPALRKSGNELIWRCANHEDRHPSLQVNANKNVFLCGPCGASGTAWQLAAFLARLDPGDIPGVTAWLKERGLLNGNGTSRSATTSTSKPRRVAEFYYSPELRKVRIEPGRDDKRKEFIWEHREGGAWRSGDGGKEKPLYANALFRERDQLGIVLGVEGESKCDLAGELGYPAFSYKNLTSAQCAVFEGLDVIFWPDKDTPGKKQWADAAKILHESQQPRLIRVIAPPEELPESGDIIDFVRMLGRGKAKIDKLIAQAKEFVFDSAVMCSNDSSSAEPAALSLPDMPESVLDGRLGEIYQHRLADFPVAYAWPALLAAASALIQVQECGTIRANIFAALVGPVHSGKTAAVERANFILRVKEPLLATLKAGSAEGLLAKIGDQQGQGVLLFPDELSHLLEKTQITNASFAYILNTLFYRSEEELTIAHGKPVKFNCRLSLIGGLVDDQFDDAFGSATTSGLYDRFLFGQFPSGFEYLWRPIEGAPAITDTFSEVAVDRDVWEARDLIAKNEKINPRILEISLRAAAICAAVDGRDRLRANALKPALELARYQSRVRILLQPNPGKNFEAKIALKVLAYLHRHAPNGAWLSLRKILKATHAYEYGPSIVERALRAMIFGGAIEDTVTTAGQKQRLVRLAAGYGDAAD